MKIAKGSKSWILASLITGLLCLVLSAFISSIILQYVFLLFSTILILLAFFFLFFFRDPERKIGQGITAVADGRIRKVKKIKNKDEKTYVFISTFMNLNNVHVNRMPIDGVVKDIDHVSGSHIPAFKKESERNERVILNLGTNIGMVKIILIAGTLARRIVPYVKKGDKLKKGEKIGIIRLGSRVDFYLPYEKIKKLNVKVNDKVKAGESTIAEIND